MSISLIFWYNEIAKSNIPKENKLMDEMILFVFYDINNFCKELKKYFEHYLITTDGESSSFDPPCGISLSEIMTVCVFFH